MRQNEHDNAGDDAADGPGADPDDQLVERVETGFHLGSQFADLALDAEDPLIGLAEPFAGRPLRPAEAAR
jgi:hypothetical protein